jgi:hypothetical protein
MSSRDEIKFAGEKLSKTFEDRAKLPLEDRRRILAELITSEHGKHDLERLTRAGDRYEARRFKAEIMAPREQLMKEAAQAALQHRMPPPALTPSGSQAHSASAMDAKLQRLRQVLETQAAARDLAKYQRIRHDRCSLENIRLERLTAMEPARRAAELEKQKNSNSRQTSRQPRSRVATSFRKASRDTGIGD